MAKHRNRGPKKLIKSPSLGDNKPLPIKQAVNAVVSNDDLLIEILLRLPVISSHAFKTVSKRWLSLIVSPDFTLRRSQIPTIDPPSGLIIPRSQGYEFAPLDMRIPSNRFRLHKTVFSFGENPSKVEILQSCNGLLLCCCKTQISQSYYVYNPFINLSRKLPLRHDNTDSFFQYGGMRMAFDPTKSPHYKVINAVEIGGYRSNYMGPMHIQIQTYSSQARNLDISDVQFPYKSFKNFGEGIYWNGSIHWLNDHKNYSVDERLHFKLDIVDHPILTEKPTPLNLNGKLFETRGCLLYVGEVKTTFQQQFRIYEMSNWNNEWSQKSIISVNDIINQCPKTWKMPAKWVCPHVPSIVLGEKEDDSFLVMELNGKVAQCNIATKTISDHICHYQFNPSDSFVFIASFAPV